MRPERATLVTLAAIAAGCALLCACVATPGATVPPATGTSRASDAIAYAAAAGEATAMQEVLKSEARNAPMRRTYCNGEYDHDCYTGRALPDPAPPGAGEPDGMTLEEARSHVLTYVNGLRSLNGLGLLERDDALTEFAQEGSLQVSRDHRGHGHFVDRADDCRGCGENQSDPRGWRPGPPGRQIDEILSLMMAEGPGGGHHDVLLSPRWTRLGVGIVNPGGDMYLTMDFAP
jgi:uncharacterized protein YkwD